METTRQVSADTAPEIEMTAPIPRAFGWWLLVLAAGMLLNTVAGPVVLDRIGYEISESMLNQLIGLEVVTLVLVVPALVLAAALALRDRAAAPLVAFGPAGYAAYMFVQYVLGPEYGAYSVTVVAHLAIASLAGVLVLWSWSLARAGAVPATTRHQQRRRAVLLGVLGGFVLFRYLPALAGAVDGSQISAEFLDARTFFWSIFLLDLGVVVPGTLIAAGALWRGTAAGQRATYAVLGWFALVPPSVASMAAVMVLRDDPHASPPTLILLSAASMVFLGFAVRVFWPLLRR